MSAHGFPMVSSAFKFGAISKNAYSCQFPDQVWNAANHSLHDKINNSGSRMTRSRLLN